MILKNGLREIPPGMKALAVQILRFAEDGIWGKLSALGIMMIAISTTLVAAASLAGAKWSPMEQNL